MRGLILMAHGARDARWAEPFEVLCARARALRPDDRVTLAFLELMQPDLESAAAALVADGCSELLVVPVFLGQGGHVRRDIPARVEAARRALGVPIALAEAAGSDAAVLEAMARYCVAQWDVPHP